GAVGGAPASRPPAKATASCSSIRTTPATSGPRSPPAGSRATGAPASPSRSRTRPPPPSSTPDSSASTRCRWGRTALQPRTRCAGTRRRTSRPEPTPTTAASTRSCAERFELSASDPPDTQGRPHNLTSRVATGDPARPTPHMSTTLTPHRTPSALRRRRVTPPEGAEGTASTSRLAGLLALFVTFSAGIHATLAPEHLKEMPPLGYAFIAAAAIGCVVACALISRPDDPRIALLAGLFCLGQITAWALFVTVRVPGFAGTPERIVSLALVSMSAEHAAVARAFPLALPRRPPSASTTSAP